MHFTPLYRDQDSQSNFADAGLAIHFFFHFGHVDKPLFIMIYPAMLRTQYGSNERSCTHSVMGKHVLNTILNWAQLPSPILTRIWQTVRPYKRGYCWHTLIGLIPFIALITSFLWQLPGLINENTVFPYSLNELMVNDWAISPLITLRHNYIFFQLGGFREIIKCLLHY